MITRLMKIAVAAAVAAFMLTACGSGETFPMASDEGLSKIKELVAEHVDTSKYKIHTVEWREDNGDRQLENILTYIDVYYIDADNNNYHLAFQLTNGSSRPMARSGTTVRPTPTPARHRLTSRPSTLTTFRKSAKRRMHW